MYVNGQAVKGDVYSVEHKALAEALPDEFGLIDHSTRVATFGTLPASDRKHRVCNTDGARVA